MQALWAPRTPHRPRPSRRRSSQAWQAPPIARLPSRADTARRNAPCRFVAERLQHDQQHDADQDRKRRNFVDPAVVDMAVAVAIVLEVLHQLAQPEMVCDEDRDQCELRVQPSAGNAVSKPQPRAGNDRQHRARRHDAVVELALHHLEAFDTDWIASQRVIDEEPRQVEQSRIPRDHEDDVQRLDPEHRRGSLARQPPPRQHQRRIVRGARVGEQHREMPHDAARNSPGKQRPRDVDGMRKREQGRNDAQRFGHLIDRKKHVKKSYPGASEFITSPNPPKVRPTINPSGSTHSASHECPNPSSMTTIRMASTDITLFDAAQTHSAKTTSSSESGALMMASHVRWTCMREKAEYMASNDEVNIALWQTMPVPMKAMYFMPPTSGTKLPMP